MLVITPFHSTFHLAFEISYSDFILRLDYKQIISDNKKKADCAVKQEFLDNSIDFRDSAIIFYTDGSKKMEEQGYIGSAIYSPKFGVSFRYILTSEAIMALQRRPGRSSNYLF